MVGKHRCGSAQRGCKPGATARVQQSAVEKGVRRRASAGSV